MTYLFASIVPCIFLFSFLFAMHRKVKVYDSFTEGIKGAIPLVLSVFPYVAAVTMLSKLLDVSGVGNKLEQWLCPFFQFLGIPKELASLVLIKPLSGSGSIAVLTDVLETYGIDSYVSRCACVLYGASETVFYIGAVYFAGLKRKKLPLAIAISLFAYLAAVLLCCLLCRFL